MSECSTHTQFLIFNFYFLFLRVSSVDLIKVLNIMMNYNIKRKNKLSDNQHQHQQPHPTQPQSHSQPFINLQQHQQHQQHLQHQQHQQFNDSLNLTNVLHYLQSEWRRLDCYCYLYLLLLSVFVGMSVIEMNGRSKELRLQ